MLVVRAERRPGPRLVEPAGSAPAARRAFRGAGGRPEDAVRGREQVHGKSERRSDKKIENLCICPALRPLASRDPERATDVEGDQCQGQHKYDRRTGEEGDRGGRFFSHVLLRVPG